MDKKANKLKQEYLNLFSQVSKVFNYTNSIQNEIYHQGKKDAYEEILNMIISENKNKY